MPARSQRIRSDFRFPLARDWPPAFLSRHHAGQTVFPAAPPIPPATSYIRLCRTLGPTASAPPSVFPPRPIPPPLQHGPVAPAAHGQWAAPATVAPLPGFFSSTRPVALISLPPSISVA